jgi:hypothetical protein|tara:strand:+ start:2800 stop:2997 length:198 start_codon:yes stop_codon:yes gene_type:complete
MDELGFTFDFGREELRTFCDALRFGRVDGDVDAGGGFFGTTTLFFFEIVLTAAEETSFPPTMMFS